ncbi:DNA-binding protein [Pseudomonas frederiksbergensis]|uniref:DNA-binding protein n=1 Tax=Pseudomonas frederiksbergensis TaxID=104087 RepID=A0A2S8HUU5_9PSED|nr:DNA-binding protein [Pseudomonas frederiksbergensis]PQP06313.1 DNA-binding protein [Pseudomonas frederiksbergensis]
MTLLLDGEQVLGKNMKITANLRIESDDMSGQTSNTQTAHKGFKPKTLAVTLMIPFIDAMQLRTIMRLAEATVGGGQLKMYRIVNDTAAAFGIREVQFSDGVSAREDDTRAAWLVQFTLSEKASNPEKVEQRRAANGVSSQSAPGQAVGGSGAAGESGSGQELSGFEKTLKKLDDYLAPTT